jgi:hypothetical protein
MLTMIHPVAIFQIALIVGWTVLFLTASGLFFSTIFRKTTTAVIMNLLLGVMLWLALPFATYSLERMWQADEYNTATTLEANPVVQLVVIAEATSGESNASSNVGGLNYDWPGQRRYRYMRYSMQGYAPAWEEKVGGTTEIIILWGAAYLVLGAFLLAIAKARLRKNPG